MIVRSSGLASVVASGVLLASALLSPALAQPAPPARDCAFLKTQDVEDVLRYYDDDIPGLDARSFQPGDINTTSCFFIHGERGVVGQPDDPPSKDNWVEASVFLLDGDGFGDLPPIDGFSEPAECYRGLLHVLLDDEHMLDIGVTGAVGPDPCSKAARIAQAALAHQQDWIDARELVAETAPDPAPATASATVAPTVVAIRVGRPTGDPDCDELSKAELASVLAAFSEAKNPTVKADDCFFSGYLNNGGARFTLGFYAEYKSIPDATGDARSADVGGGAVCFPGRRAPVAYMGKKGAGFRYYLWMDVAWTDLQPLGSATTPPNVQCDVMFKVAKLIVEHGGWKE